MESQLGGVDGADGRDEECIFLFQAEGGIRDGTVTGVQTCALPISDPSTDPPDAAELAAGWLAWWHALIGLPPPSPPSDPARPPALLAFDPADFPALAAWPALRRGGHPPVETGLRLAQRPHEGRAGGGPAPRCANRPGGSRAGT